MSEVSISAASLASYYNLLPSDARAVESARRAVFDAPLAEPEYVVEHSPLRTKLKSDNKHAVRTRVHHAGLAVH
jgi:hypothetical protein